MKYKLMDCVRIVSDTLGYNLPVGETGYIISIDRQVDQALPYCVRVPSKQENWWVPECDLMLESEWVAKSVDNVIRESIVNYALDTKNKELFKSISNMY